MSNYGIGFFTTNNEETTAAIAETIRAQSMIGFHIFAARNLPKVAGFPDAEDRVYFYLSDNNDVLHARELLLEMDWAPEYITRLPTKLIDRIALIVATVETVAKLSRSPRIGLWLSEVDQLEKVTEVRLSSLFDTILSDFDRVVIPCILYEIIV